jgi:pimeloyl-ACP methyl ester carboxylesterase
MYRFIDPLSRVIAPLSDGLLRRGLQRFGIEDRYANLMGINIHYYYRPAALGQRRRRIRSMWRMARQPVLHNDKRSTPIVLVHGLGDNALTWAMVLQLVAAGREVYAIDLPGYGLSGLPSGQISTTLSQICEVLEQFLQGVVGQPAVVVGNSLGGWLAVRVAEHVPEAFSELVLVNAGGAYLDGRTSWEGFREVVGVADLKTTRRAIRQVLGLVPPMLVFLGQRGIQERFQRPVVRAFVEQAGEQDFLRPDELQSLRLPVSLIWGLKDRFLPTGSREFFQKYLPNAPMLAIRHCGHLPQRERPLLVARFIDQIAYRIDMLH